MFKNLCIALLTSCMLVASEDVDSKTSQKATSKSEFIEPSVLPNWIHSIGQLVIYFQDGELKTGYGALLSGGFFITSADVVRKKHTQGYLYPSKVALKMQDDSANPLICVANLKIHGIDEDMGIALLKTQNFTDEYCNKRAESFYHARLYNLFALKIFDYQNGLYKPLGLDSKIKVGYAKIPNSLTFKPDYISGVRDITYYDEKLEENIYLGFDAESIDSAHPRLGSAFFNDKGELFGIYVKTVHYDRPLILSTRQIKSFLCGVKSTLDVDLWSKSDCLRFQRGVIDNIKGILNEHK